MFTTEDKIKMKEMLVALGQTDPSKVKHLQQIKDILERIFADREADDTHDLVESLNQQILDNQISLARNLIAAMTAMVTAVTTLTSAIVSLQADLASK
jgi:hypothetical protein